MIPVGNFLQVIILIVHRDSPCHIPQQRQPKGAESEPEPGMATGDHRVLSQEPPLRVPELLFGERASRARAAGKALRERQGKEPEAGAAPREPLRDRAAGQGQRGTAGHSDGRSDRHSDTRTDTRTLAPLGRPAAGGIPGWPLPCPAPQLSEPLSPAARIARVSAPTPDSPLLLRAAHPRERLFQEK